MKYTQSQNIGLLALICTALTGGLLMSCQPSSEEAGPAELSILEWSGFDKPRYYPEYTAKYGEPPAFTIFADTNDAMQRMRNGLKTDLAHLCTGQMHEAGQAGLIKPLDTSRIPRWDEITTELLDLPDVRIDGQYWLAPWEWGYSTVGYNPEIIEVENPTYQMFIDPRFKGKTALPADVEVSLYIAGITAGWQDPLDPTEAEMETAPGIFKKMLTNARFIWTDSTQLEQAWAAGDVGISYIYGSASRRMPKEGLPVIVVEPLLTWMCGLSLSTAGQAPEEQAYDYINAMLDPRSGVALFDEYGYGHGNANTVTLIDPARVIGTGIDDPDGTFARGVYSKALPPAKKARLFQLWFEAQAGLE
jgi:spermidine/putrescine-binding protein